MALAYPRHAGQPARAGGRDRGHRRREPERFRQGAQTDRRRDQRLLRARVLLQQPRPAPANTTPRSEDIKAGCERVVADVVFTATAAAAGAVGTTKVPSPPLRTADGSARTPGSLRPRSGEACSFSDRANQSAGTADVRRSGCRTAACFARRPPRPATG